ncbi:MAG: protein kinase [Polyangiales bacterium]
MGGRPSTGPPGGREGEPRSEPSAEASPAGAEPAADPLLGRLLDGRYRVIEQLAEGGMGKVYRAEHLGLHKEVALKLVSEGEGASPDHAQRFLREALLTSRIDHPNVISAMDYGTFDDGTAYLAMNLANGPTLASVIEAEGRMPWPRVAEIGAQIADAAAAAQAQGIVHRDLKPENVILQPLPNGSEMVKVLDFGIAKYARDSLAPPAMRSAQKVTRVGTVVGTPGYMAPEQAVGMRADHRSDLYCIGVLMWECVVGHKLWDFEDVQQLLTTQLSQPAPSVRDASGDETIPYAFEGLVASLLATRAHERPDSAIEVRDALRVLVEDARQNDLMPTLPPRPRPVVEPRASQMAVTLDFRPAGRVLEANAQAIGEPTRVLGVASDPRSTEELNAGEIEPRSPEVQVLVSEPPTVPRPWSRLPRWVWAVAIGVGLLLLVSTWLLRAPRSPHRDAAATLARPQVTGAPASNPSKGSAAELPRKSTAGTAEALQATATREPTKVGAAPPVATSAPAAASEPTGSRPTTVTRSAFARQPRGRASAGGESAEQLRAKAREYFVAGRYRECATRYELAAEQAPSHAGTYAGLGACQLALGDSRGALVSYQRAIQLSPDSAGFYAALGRAYLTAGDPARARAAYKKAIALDPHNQAAQAALAHLER